MNLSDAIGLEIERRGMSKYTESGLIADLNRKIATQQARIEALEARLVKVEWFAKKHRYSHGGFPYDELAALLQEGGDG